MSYSDGPFRSPQKDLKRTASQMESSSNDTGSQSFSQDAQRPQPLEAYSQDTNLNTISSTQLQDAITSALSENASEPPRKRVKATHPTRSKTLASHAATAVVGALLGGLGTIAMLAALPPNYFH
jgi:chemotaxis response regulator CheB